MIEAAFAVDEIDLFNAWIVLKTLDEKTNDGKGYFNKGEILSLLTYWFKIGKSSAYRVLSDGSDIYWMINSDRVFMKGIVKICNHLGIHILNKRGMHVNIENLCQNKGENRSYLIGILVAGAETPQSYDNIAERCGICKRTAISYIRECPHLHTIPNYTIISNHKFKEDMLASLGTVKDNNPREANRYQALRDNGGYYVGYRLPNSFASELSFTSSKAKKRINKKTREGNPGMSTDFRGVPLEHRIFNQVNKKKSVLKNAPNYYSYRATVKEVIIGENSVQEEMRIWSDDK